MAMLEKFYRSPHTGVSHAGPGVSHAKGAYGKTQQEDDL